VHDDVPGRGVTRGLYSVRWTGSLPRPPGWTRPTAAIPTGSWLPCPTPPSSMSPQPTSPVWRSAVEPVEITW